ncbi:hypothetical protein HK405_009079 [Cladochytrium tenue]|nr:hypothetical protein HK405_009079 [Cladochytrium tenue]
MDTDVMAIRNPTFLFETGAFKKFGAIFWPDFPATPRTNPIWNIMNQDYRLEREFETGIVVVDKKRAWQGLRMAQHLCAEARFYFKYIFGDKDSFRWGFKVTATPYFLVPNYLQSVGVLVSKTHPSGNELLEESDWAPSDSNRSEFQADPVLPHAEQVPQGAHYCGQSMLQMDFQDVANDDGRQSGLSQVPELSLERRGAPQSAPENTSSTEFHPSPLFMHANGVKRARLDGVAPFQVGMAYVDRRPLVERIAGHGGRPGVRGVDDVHGAGANWIGRLLDQRECLDLATVNGLQVQVWSE